VGRTFWQPVEGIIPPLVTPLAGPETLDHEGLARLVERVIAGGVSALFILGTSGEAPCLSYRLRRELIQRVCALARDRLPVWVGITDTAMAEAVSLGRFAAEAGARALVTAPPYYFPAGQPELVHFIRQLVAQLPLPLILYNMPQMTKVRFELDTLAQLMELEPVVGLKDSSGDMEYFARAVELARRRPDWRVWVGPEECLWEALRRGGHGGINGGAQIVPQWFVGLTEAHRAGDETRAAELQQKILRLGAIYRVERHASAVVKGLKCALSLLGVCRDDMAPPFESFRPPERARVRAILEELGLLEPQPGAMPSRP
jgi:dihydrodipicolinate synthase/N-acetylneuraminate lyase